MVTPIALPKLWIWLESYPAHCAQHVLGTTALQPDLKCRQSLAQISFQLKHLNFVKHIKASLEFERPVLLRSGKWQYENGKAPPENLKYSKTNFLFAAFTSRSGRSFGKHDLAVLIIGLLADIHDFSSVDFSFSSFLLCSEFCLHHRLPLRSLLVLSLSSASSGSKGWDFQRRRRTRSWIHPWRIQRLQGILWQEGGWGWSYL